jgi:hypothetical protein
MMVRRPFGHTRNRVLVEHPVRGRRVLREHSFGAQHLPFSRIATASCGQSSGLEPTALENRHISCLKLTQQSAVPAKTAKQMRVGSKYLFFLERLEFLIETGALEVVKDAPEFLNVQIVSAKAK